MINKETEKNKNSSFLIEEKINFELKKFVFYAEGAFSFFCYLTGGLSMKIDYQELFELIKIRENKKFDLYPEEKVLDLEELHERYYERLKNYHEEIFNSIKKINRYFCLLLCDKFFTEKLDSIETVRYSNNFRNIFNIFYSSSILETLKNLYSVFQKSLAKSEKIYSMYLNKREFRQIIKEVYGKESLDFKNNFLNFINIIHSDQTILEEALLMIKKICKIDKNDYLLWLKNTQKMIKKS